MQVINGDILFPTDDVDAVCVTTNMQRRNNGTAVMGAGIALAAHRKWNLDIILGNLLQRKQNGVVVIKKIDKLSIVAVPTKKDWRNPSTIELISLSLDQLVSLADEESWQTIWVPSMGTNNGKLSTDVVWPIMHDKLNDRFRMVLKK